MFNFGKKKKDVDLALSGGKKTVATNSKSNIKPKKQPVKSEDKGETKTVTPKKIIQAPVNNKAGSLVKFDFKDITDVPKEGKISSEDEKSPYYISKDFQKHILIIETMFTPGGVGEKRSCVLFICTEKYRTKVEINKLRKAARSKNQEFVYCAKSDASSFITALKKERKRDENKKNEVFSDMQQKAIDLFQETVDNGASDLHIEVRKGRTVIRTRVNGDITPFHAQTFGGSSSIPEDDGMDLCRSIFNSLSAVDGNPFNKRKTQDTLVVINSPREGEPPIRVRVATAPSEPEGFDMVMRLLVVKESSKPLTLEMLGYQKKQREMIEEGIAQGVGVTIVAGTTGSGKSTTLQNILKSEIQSKNEKIKVITVEDPPEYFIPGSTQIPVSRDADGDAKKAFKNALKASMRMDPDVIMIGEVRDEQSAELLIEAVQTGHKVMSTIHASSALSIIGRLENLGIDKDILGENEFISGLIYQKLFPVLCKHCAIPLKDGEIPSKRPIEKILIENNLASEDSIRKAKHNNPKVPLIRALQDEGFIDLEQAERALSIFKKENNEEDNEKFLKRISSVAGKLEDHTINFRGEGCEHCKNGISGRTVVSEVVRPDMKLRELIVSGKSTEVYKYWRKILGGKPACEDAYDKMLNGLISPVDIEDTFGYIKPNNDM